MKKLIVMVFTLVLVLCISGCGSEKDGCVWFTLEEAKAANETEAIIEKHGSIKLELNAESYVDKNWIFEYGDTLASAGETDGSYYGYCKGFSWGEEGEYRYMYSTVKSDGTMETDGSENVYVPSFLPEKGTIEYISDDKDTVTASVKAEDEEDAVEITFNKEDLTVTSVKRNYEGEEIVWTITYGEDVSEIVKKMDDMFKETRTVTVVLDNITETLECVMEVPVGWDYMPLFTDDYTLYMNEDYIGEYSCPDGDGDFTVYATLSKG